MTMGLLFVEYKAVASGASRCQKFEDDSWIDFFKSSQDFVGLNHVSSFSYVIII